MGKLGINHQKKFSINQHCDLNSKNGDILNPSQRNNVISLGSDGVRYVTNTTIAI